MSSAKVKGAVKAEPKRKGRPPLPTMSIPQYAASRGIHAADVRRAIGQGLIHLEADGRIDPERATREWAANITPDPSTAPGGVQRGGKTISFAQARTEAELLKQERAKLDLRKRHGEVVDRSQASAYVFQFVRRIRDSWLSWPSRVAAVMAAEIGCDPHLLERALERSVNENLKTIGNVDPDLR